MKRREFVRTVGAAAGALCATGVARGEEPEPPKNQFGILIDSTRCVGCRSCEAACAEANGMPEMDSAEETAEGIVRKTSETRLTVVNSYETDAGPVCVKTQCMHCIQPACASACLTKAMVKTEEGPVVWDESKCMGCRFCMISCPFDAPKFEYHSAMPRIRKCTMCWTRLRKGETPACVEACPAEALTFGPRRELLDEARARIYGNPDTYIHEIYGEREAGGTGVLYLSSVPFSRIGLRTGLDTTPYPALTKEFLYGVPIVLTLWPAFLLALSEATKREPAHPDRGVTHED